MQEVDALLHPRWIVPVVPRGKVLEDHSLVIRGDLIEAVVARDEAERRYHADVQYDLPHHVLIPGLVNAHTHACMSLLRGLADDLPLKRWLNDHIWPAEKRWVSEEFVHDGTRLALAEMLRSGTTTFNEMYFFPEVVARAAAAVGVRAAVGLIVFDFPSAWAGSGEEYLRRGLEVHDQFRNEPLITTAFAPHAPYTVSDPWLQRVVTYANELDLPVHMHVHETAGEVDEAVAADGKRPLQRLDELGLITPALQAVHMTALNDAEIELLAARAAHVVHCPESNLKLASGFCPVHTLMQAGVNVALGTDGAASNNDLDMFAEMRTAALLAKAVAGEASAVPAETALAMATLHGARAMGMEDRIGSLEPGKAADLVAVDLSAVETQPLYQVISQLVYSAGREQVTDVWVAGQHVLNRRQLTTLDSGELLERTRVWRERIRVSDDPADARA